MSSSPSAPKRRVSTIISGIGDKRENDNSEILQKYAAYNSHSKITRKTIGNISVAPSTKNCHLAALKGDLKYLMRAISHDPSLVSKVYQFSDNKLLSEAELNDPYYLAPPQLPKLIRAALQVTNQSQLTLDQRWLLQNSFSKCTLLHYACAGDQLGVTRYLVEKGADRGALNSAGREPEHYTTDELLREFLWTCPTLSGTEGATEGTKKPRAAHRNSIFHSSHSADHTAALLQLQQLPSDTPAIQQRTLFPPPPPVHRPSVSAASTLFAAHSSREAESSPPPVRAASGRGPPAPPPPPPVTMSSHQQNSNINRSSHTAPPPPPKFLPPSGSVAAPARQSSISQLIERTRKSISAAAEEAAPEPTENSTRSSIIGVSGTGDRKSISKRRLSRVMQSRRYSSSSRVGEQQQLPKEEKEEDFSNLPMLELPAAQPQQPMVFRKLSIVTGNKLQEECYLVDGDGVTEYKQSAPDMRIDSPIRRTDPNKGGTEDLSSLSASLQEVIDDSADYLEAWEIKVAGKDGSGGSDALSVISATLGDAPSMQGAKEAAKLFARAKIIEKEEARLQKKRQSVMRIYQKMPPIEDMASALIRQHNNAPTGATTIVKTAESPGNVSNNVGRAEQALMDKYHSALLCEEAELSDDELADLGAPPHGSAEAAGKSKKSKKKAVDIHKLTFREMIWCKAGMGMSISEQSTTNPKTGDVVKLRVDAYKQGLGLMRQEFRSYAFKEHWEALGLEQVAASTSTAAPSSCATAVVGKSQAAAGLGGGEVYHQSGTQQIGNNSRSNSATTTSRSGSRSGSRSRSSFGVADRRFSSGKDAPTVRNSVRRSTFSEAAATATATLTIVTTPDVDEEVDEEVDALLSVLSSTPEYGRAASLSISGEKGEKGEKTGVGGTGPVGGGFGKMSNSLHHPPRRSSSSAADNSDEEWQ